MQLLYNVQKNDPSEYRFKHVLKNVATLEVIQKIVYVNKRNELKCCCVALPNISRFQRFKRSCFNICSFAKSIYSPNITMSMTIKSSFNFSTRDFRPECTAHLDRW